MSELVEQVARAIAGPMQDVWQEFMTEAEAALSVLEPRIAQQAEEVARLREALKPFARAAGNIPKRFDDSRHVSSEIPLRRDELDEGVTAASLVVSLDGIDVGDYRNARAALNEQPGGEG